MKKGKLASLGFALLLATFGCSRQGGGNLPIASSGVSGGGSHSGGVVAAGSPLPAAAGRDETVVPRNASPIPSLVDGGNGGGNAGDPDTGVRYSGLQEEFSPIPEAPLEHFQKLEPERNFAPGVVRLYWNDFYRQGYRALWGILLLRERGHDFNLREGKVMFAPEDIYAAMAVLDDINDNHPERFRLVSPLFIGNQAVTAKNYPNGAIDLDPMQWRAQGERHTSFIAGLLKGMVAAHEALSMTSRHLERTGHYPLSSAVLAYKRKELRSYYPEGHGRFLRLLTTGGGPGEIGLNPDEPAIRWHHRETYTHQYSRLMAAYETSKGSVVQKERLAQRLISLVVEARESRGLDPTSYDSSFDRDWTVVKRLMNDENSEERKLEPVGIMIPSRWLERLQTSARVEAIGADGGSDAGDVPAISSYLSLSPGTATRINELFSSHAVKVSDGLYFTNQEEAARRGELNGGLLSEVALDLELESGGGELVVGFAGQFPSLELWAIRPGVGKYLLGQFEFAGSLQMRFKSNRFLSNPRYFIPVDDGVVAFADDWIFYRRHQLPDPTTGKPKSVTVNVRAFTQSFDPSSKEAQAPIMAYHRSVNKMLIAVWPKLPKSGTELPPSLVNLVLVDLENDRAKPVLNGLTWPFYLTEDGVYYAAGGALAYRRFDWKAETFAAPVTTWLFNYGTDRLEVDEKNAFLVQPGSRGQEHRYRLSRDGHLLPR